MFRKAALISFMSLVLAACAGMGDRTPPPAYIVFFTFDSATLSDAAQSVVKQAADDAKRVKPMRIQLAGFTGNEPDARTAEPLAQARFSAVETALVSAGIDKAIITRTTLNDPGPLPDTAVRRIEIRFAPPAGPIS